MGKAHNLLRPEEGPVGQGGAWDPKWFTGSMSPSLGHPSLLYP